MHSWTSEQVDPGEKLEGHDLSHRTTCLKREPRRTTVRCRSGNGAQGKECAMLAMIEPFPSYCSGSRFCAEFILKSPGWGSENMRRSIHNRRIPCKPQMHRGGYSAEKSNGNGPCRIGANVRPSCGCTEGCLLVQKARKSTCYHSMQVALCEHLHPSLFHQSNGSFPPPPGGLRRTSLFHPHVPFPVSFL